MGRKTFHGHADLVGRSSYLTSRIKGPSDCTRTWQNDLNILRRLGTLPEPGFETPKHLPGV